MKNVPWALRFLLMILLALSASPLAAAQVPQAQYIVGRVMRGNTPARSVWVILYDGSIQKARTLTGDDAKYYLGGLSNKSYTLVVRQKPVGPDLFRGQVSLPSNKSFNIRLPQ